MGQAAIRIPRQPAARGVFYHHLRALPTVLVSVRKTVVIPVRSNPPAAFERPGSSDFQGTPGATIRFML